MADQKGDFIAGVVAGAVLGGIIGGVIAFVLAPRLSKGSAEGQRRDPDRLNGTSVPPERPRLRVSGEPAVPSSSDWREWEQETERIPQARRTLEAKIAELNEAIQATRAQLLVKEISSSAVEEKP
ncbi:hypothetical protein [Synechococcus sp. OH2]|uniref:hypothetical protein n=1 Tax=Synechococcus sp. OH2 TaxID=136798 RepID=UPI0039C3B780